MTHTEHSEQSLSNVGPGKAQHAPNSVAGTPEGTDPPVVAEAVRRRPDLEVVLRAYFRHVPPEDLPRTTEDVLSIVEWHQRTATRRVIGEAKVRLHNPPANAGGTWSATSTVIDIVNDDMPYLVEAVIGSLSAHGVTVHRVLHPILAVERDPDGNLVRVVGEPSRNAHQPGTRRESWVHVLIDRLSDAERAEIIESDLADSLDAVRAVNADTASIVGAATMAATELRSSLSPRPVQEVAEAGDLLYWLTAGNLTFLGYRRCEPDDSGAVVPVAESGLGVLRTGLPYADIASTSVLGKATDGAEGHLLLTQMSEGAAINRESPPFVAVVRILGSDGALVREHHFHGVFTPRALTAEVTTIPVIRHTVAHVLGELGATPDSWSGQRAMDQLAMYPRSELFWADPDLVVQVVTGALQLSSRRRLRIQLQADPFGRFVAVFVHLPRDRWTTDTRLAMQQLLLDTLHGTDIRYAVRIGESELAFIHFTVSLDPARTGGTPADLDDAAVLELHRAMRSTARTWEDRLVATVVGGGGDEDLDTAGALSRYATAFDASYKKDYSVSDAVADLERLDSLSGPDDLALAFSEIADPAADRRLKLFVTGGTVTLSRALPVLQSLGAEVMDERPYEVRRSDGTPSHIYDFGLRFGAAHVQDEELRQRLRSRLSEAFVAAWQGHAEVDNFNTLVIAADLDWRTIAVLRAYAHYLRQIGSLYTQGYVEQVLTSHPEITRDLALLFTTRFDPTAVGDSSAQDVEQDSALAGPVRLARAAELADRIRTALDAVTSLDADRILRTYLAMIEATVRTNAYRTDDQGRHREFLSFKLIPRLIPGMPKPVPAHEIWVYSPRVEGVHLRFGAVARGGLRWSDRPEDFRTEVLGLVKAQEVKNAVIVPVGAKGGFVVKQPPVPTGDAGADREAFLAEGVACYRMFIAGLLDVTDNRLDGAIVPPPLVVRHDTDDSYLVVAADKGTASFSDIANSVAGQYNFWLGDAFASGGSAGYDHKGMGITARGAWESVKHHFRELGVDTQSQDFTVVGVGDMSGDVFGNGMLLSDHIRLVAAFDHRHVFIDPTPDAASSWAERRRLFDTPRSSWDDYDRSLISAGGGIWPRTAKSIPITDQMRTALGLPAEVTALTPVELIKAAVLAPVDLLWNGGIGTYVKASTESHQAVGDKANDAVRVDGQDLRVKVVGEGGNLGVTQLGRIEFARRGGRINTDAIDNSAGVDTSDHEVNIKIALQPAVADGRLSVEGRDELLVSMTDEVAELVLADNIAQNRLLGVARHHAVPMLSVHARLIDELVASGRLDRALEFLPKREQIEERIAAGEPLSSPELAVLVAYVKSALSVAMLDSDLPDDPAFTSLLASYFPSAMRGLDVVDIPHHPLAREIVTTMTVNDVINAAGITYVFRLKEELAADPVDAIRAYRIASEVFGLDQLRADVAALDHQVPAELQDALELEVRRLMDRAVRWLLTNRPQPLDVGSEIRRYAGAAAELLPKLPRLVCGVEHDNVVDLTEKWVAAGTPTDLARRIAYSLYAFSVLDIEDVALAGDYPRVEAATAYFALSAHLDFDRLLSAVSALDRGDRWHALARQALRDDMYRSMRLVCADVLDSTDEDADLDVRIQQWEVANAARLQRARTTLAEIGSSASDLAALSVAAAEVRTMAG